MIGDRTRIADALSTVTGVSGHVALPPSPTAWQGWPVWQRTEYTNVPSCGAVPEFDEWFVWLLLPALDPNVVDQVRDLVAAALSQVGDVADAEPDTYPLQQDQPGVIGIRYSVTTRGGPQIWP